MESEFDEMAMSWDDDPARKERAADIAGFLLDKQDMTHLPRAFEYGSGTGLLSFAMQDKFSSIDLMDASEEMTKVAALKIEKAGAGHMRAHWGDLLSGAQLPAKVDIIYTMLTLHHVKETAKLLSHFSKTLNPGGKLVSIVVVDEVGRFLDFSDLGGQLGFARVEL